MSAANATAQPVLARRGLAFAATSLVLGLSACVSHYQPRPGAPTATLVIDSNSAGFVQAFRSEACDKPEAGSRISFLHPTAGDRLRGTAKPIEADRPLILSVYSNSPHEGQMASCGVTARFTPQAGQQYVLMYRVSHESRQCTLNLLRHTSDGALEAEPGLTQLPNVCRNSIDG